jgi:rhodanese-related sulfurtransferase
VALRLRELGFGEAFALKGGLRAWEEAHLPEEPLVRGDPGTNAVLHQPM